MSGKISSGDVNTIVHLEAENQRLRDRVRGLEDTLNEVWPRYCDLFEDAGLGRALRDSVIAHQVRATLATSGRKG